MGPWIPTLITLGSTFLSAFAEPIQAFIAGHPKAAVIMGGVYAMFKGFLPSPVQAADQGTAQAKQ